MHISLKSNTGMTAAQQRVMQETGLLMSHSAALHHLRNETALARMQLHRISGTVSPADAITAATRAAAIEQAPRGCTSSPKQTGCNTNCGQGRRCTCTGASMPRLAPRATRRAPTRIEQRASDFGALDLTHQEHDATAGEVAEQMTVGDKVMARVYRWGWRIALVAAAGIWMTGCGGGAAPADRFEPALAPSAQQATAPALSVLIVGDSTMTPVYPGEASTPDIVQQLLPGDRITNAAVSGTTACQADLQAIRTAHADVVVANYGINDAYGNASAPRHSLTDYAACLAAIADAARDAGSALVMLEANPILPSPGWNPARIADYNQAKRATGGAYYCAQPAIRWTSAELPDGQHPAAPAKPAIAAALATCIRNAL